MIYQPLSPGGVHPQISSSLRLLVFCLFRPNSFVIHYCLFVFSKNSFLSLAPLTNATPAFFKALIFKPLRGNRKLLVTKNFLFILNVFFLSHTHTHTHTHTILITSEIVVCELFLFLETVQIFSFSLHLTNNIILTRSKFKPFADDKILVSQKSKFVLGRGEKTLWEKEKMLVTIIFSFSRNIF